MLHRKFFREPFRGTGSRGVSIRYTVAEPHLARIRTRPFMGRNRIQRQTRSRSARKSLKVAPEYTGLSHKSRNALFCVLLAISVFALYGSVLTHPFVVFDDQDYVTQNPHVRQGLSWTTVKWAFTATRSANWHPLTWLSHAVDCQLFGLNAGAHHLDSLFLHGLNAVLLFLLLELATSGARPSLLVAALFALHPLNVESVAWVAERKNVLSTLFFLLAIGAYGWYACKPNWLRYSLIVLLFGMGLMAKPMVITLPFALLLLDYWPLNRTPGSDASPLHVPQRPVWKLLLEKVPLLFLSAASAVITIKAQVFAVRTLQDFPFSVRVENALVAYAQYLCKMVWPARLAALYPHPGRGLHGWQVIVAVLLLAGISAVVTICRSRRYLLVGWLWFLGTLVPVIGLVQVGYAAMADRYAYIPLIGIFVMIAFGVWDLADAKNVHLAYRMIPALCALAAFSLITHRQLSYWKSEYDVWAHAVQTTERNSFAHNALGEALLAPQTSMSEANLHDFDTPQKRIERARWHYEQALQICRELEQQDPGIYLPWLATTLNNLGDLDRQQHRMGDANHRYMEALDIHRSLVEKNPADLPYLAKTINNLAFLDKFEEHPDEARAHFAEALQNFRRMTGPNTKQYLPDVATTLNNLAVAEADEHDLQQAGQHFQEALQISRQLAQQEPTTYLPDVAMTLNNLGNLDLEQKQFEAARLQYEESLTLYRDLAQRDSHKFLSLLAGTLNNLGLVEKDLNQIEAARSHYEAALTIYRTLSKQDPRRFVLHLRRVELGLAELNAQPGRK
jgi:tetratricopeptide (TPR) repeat protein